MKSTQPISRLSMLAVALLVGIPTPASADTSTPLFSGQIQLYVPPVTPAPQHFGTLAVIPAPADIATPPPSPCQLAPNEIAVGGIRDGASIYNMEKETINGRIFMVDGVCRKSTFAAVTYMPTGKVDYVDDTYFAARFDALEIDLWNLMEAELSPDELTAYRSAFDATCAENACDVFDRLRKTFTFLTVAEILP